MQSYIKYDIAVSQSRIAVTLVSDGVFEADRDLVSVEVGDSVIDPVGFTFVPVVAGNPPVVNNIRAIEYILPPGVPQIAVKVLDGYIPHVTEIIMSAN